MKKTIQEIEDDILEHRYRYYILNNPIISDYEYDKLEKDALLLVPESSIIHKPGSDLKKSYPKHIIDKFRNYEPLRHP